MSGSEGVSSIPDWFIDVTTLVCLAAELAKLKGIDLDEMHAQPLER